MSAQGLFMYFEEDQVRHLVVKILERFPGVELMFDTVPRWVSRKSLGSGFSKTPNYTAPPMPWGIGQDELAPLLRSWSRRVGDVRTRPYGFWRGPGVVLLTLSTHVPWFRNIAPAIAHVKSTVEER